MITQVKHMQAKWMVLMILVVFTLVDASLAVDIYVSDTSGAQADGSLEKPYGSLSIAVKAARALRKAGHTEPIKIILRNGRYQLNQTLVLGLEDGAPVSSQAAKLEKYGAGDVTGAAYLTFAAYPGEYPVVSAGVPVTGWTRLGSALVELPFAAKGKVWVADMPEGMDRFNTLFDAQGRLQRARDDVGFKPTAAGTATKLHFPPGKLRDWDNMEDVEIFVRPYRLWTINMLPLKSVDTSTHVATTAKAATYTLSPLKKMPTANTVWVENVLDHLDKPGEWVVNTKTRKIYVWPRDTAADGSPRGILAPSTSELIRVEGKINYDGPTDVPVKGIAFHGLTFTHGDRKAWWEYEQREGWGLQHDWDMFDSPTAMLRFRGAETCQVVQCRFVQGGGSGLRFDLHAQRNRVIDCEFEYLGEAGLLLAGYGPGSKDVNKHNDIINNHIHHFSEIMWHSPGIWAWQSGYNRIKNNHIHHNNYSSVLLTCRIKPNRNANSEGGRTVRRAELPNRAKQDVNATYEGWKRREPYLHSRHNRVEYNEITHAWQKMGDGNAIYVSGAGSGNIVRYNYIHDNLTQNIIFDVVRCDDDQHETLIYGNILFNNYCRGGAIHSKGKNDVVNNVIVRQAGGHISYGQYPPDGAVVQKNIVYASSKRRPVQAGKSLVDKPISLAAVDIDSNLYFHADGPEWVEQHFASMRAQGNEKASLFGDPLFANPGKGDFSFRPDSPALKLGIEPLDTSKMGRLESYSLSISDK
ncbi:right-handed parallel beta-helix repeat-containing protein [Planctomycetota bacterium]